MSAQHYCFGNKVSSIWTLRATVKWQQPFFFIGQNLEVESFLSEFVTSSAWIVVIHQLAALAILPGPCHRQRRAEHAMRVLQCEANTNIMRKTFFFKACLSALSLCALEIWVRAYVTTRYVWMFNFFPISLEKCLPSLLERLESCQHYFPKCYELSYIPSKFITLASQLLLYLRMWLHLGIKPLRKLKRGHSFTYFKILYHVSRPGQAWE